MVATWKHKEIEELTEKLGKAKVVGLVNITGIPSRQFQLMRKSLKGKADIKISRSNLIKRAFENAKIKDLDQHMEGSMGLILTDLNPFKLNKILKDSKISSPAKAGNIAPRDIMVPAGDTGLPAGPIIGDLQKAGVKAQIQAGKIVVTKDSPVVKEGEKIDGTLALILTRLGIEPMEIGLDMTTAYEEGMIYTSDVLSIDQDTVMANVLTAHAGAVSLALNAKICNKETVKLFLSESYTKALNLAMNAEIFNKETIDYLLAKANREMLSVASRAPDGLDDDLKATVSSTPAASSAQVEEKKEEVKEENTEEDAASGLASLFG